MLLVSATYVARKQNVQLTLSHYHHFASSNLALLTNFTAQHLEATSILTTFRICRLSEKVMNWNHTFLRYPQHCLLN